MIYIQPWKDLLDMPLGVFCNIEKQFVEATGSHSRNAVEENLQSKKADLYEQWRQSKQNMREAGLQSIDTPKGRIWLEIGFYGFPHILTMDGPQGKEEIFQYSHTMHVKEDFTFCSQEDFDEACKMRRADELNNRMTLAEIQELTRDIEAWKRKTAVRTKPRADLDGFEREE
jgi:hypothetical protein